jgi:hypothetical protein
VGKPLVKYLVGRPGRRCEDNLKMALREAGDKRVLAIGGI